MSWYDKVQLDMSYTWPGSRLRPCSMSWTPIRFSVSNFQMLNLSLARNKKGSRGLTISIGNIIRSRCGSWPGNLKCLPTGFTVFSWQVWVAVPRWPPSLCVKLLDSPSPQMPTYVGLSLAHRPESFWGVSRPPPPPQVMTSFMNSP